jgi:hypothetical protein
MGYNEIYTYEEPNPFVEYKHLKDLTMQFETLINCINDDDKSLRTKMDRYLESASLSVFVSHGSIKNVFEVLQNHIIRKQFIDKIPERQRDNLSEYIMSLSELDEIKNGEVVGTKTNSSLSGIIDRLTVLKKNAYLELMLKRDCSNNINLLTEIQKNQLIIVKMPENMFATDTEKDIYATYWLTKLWLTLQIREDIIERENHVKVNLIIDELNKKDRLCNLLAAKLSEMAKYSVKPILTCHHFDQLGELQKALKSAHASYSIIQGSDISNFMDLKIEFEHYGMTVDDLLNLQQFNAMSLLSYEENYWAGVTALPPQIK